jgi:hypothetical protein
VFHADGGELMMIWRLVTTTGETIDLRAPSEGTALAEALRLRPGAVIVRAIALRVADSVVPLRQVM